MKCCSKCKETKPIQEFDKDKNKKDGLRYECKSCRVGKNSTWYSNWSSTPRGRALILVNSSNQRKRGGKRIKLERSLTIDDVLPILEKGKCQLTGLPFDFHPAEKTYKNPYAPSLDRIDSQKGYTRDNVRVVLSAVNEALGEYEDEEILPILEAMVKGIKENAEQKQSTSVPTQHTGASQDNSQFGTVHGAGVGQDCDGAHHHRGEPQGQDSCDSTEEGCRICMGTGVRKMATLETFYGGEGNGDTLCTSEEFAKRIRCLCYQP